MTKSQNKGRKFRRKEKDKENATKGQDQKPVKFNQKEQAIFNEAATALATAKTNQQNIIAINNDTDGLRKMINAYDNKMALYDKDEIVPRFETSEKKIDLLLDLVLRSEIDIELSDDEMKILELEEFEEEIEDKDVVAPSSNNGAPPEKIEEVKDHVISKVPKKKPKKTVKTKNE